EIAAWAGLIAAGDLRLLLRWNRRGSRRRGRGGRGAGRTGRLLRRRARGGGGGRSSRRSEVCHELVRRELAPYRRAGEARAGIGGPTVLLEPTTAQTIAGALHELATNGAKYGTLPVPEGNIQVEWSRTSDGRLVLRWIESGGPPVKRPTRQGFGTHVIQRM